MPVTPIYIFTTESDTLTVDFGAATISGMITAGGRNFFTAGFGGLYGVTLAGTINGNLVAGATGSGVAVGSGQFRLLFLGPNADEVILTVVVRTAGEPTLARLWGFVIRIFRDPKTHLPLG
jgi:hypothetical protein